MLQSEIVSLFAVVMNVLGIFGVVSQHDVIVCAIVTLAA